MSMESYSTLEVDRCRILQHLSDNPGDGIDYNNFPEVPPVEQLEANKGADEWHKERVPLGTEDLEAISSPAYGTGSEECGTPGAHVYEKTPHVRILGLRRRVWVIIITALLIIGALVGGLVGGLSDKSSSQNSSTASASANVNILDVSTLSASNWTDSQNFNHRIVYFQDPYGNVVGRRWDAQNQTWATTNISMVMANSATPLDLVPGVSLAAAAAVEVSTDSYAVQLWFLDRFNSIKGVMCNDPVGQPDLWQNYSTGNTPGGGALRGSKLAASWNDCKGGGGGAGATCENGAAWVVAFQGPIFGAVNIVNSTNWSYVLPVFGGDKAVARNTSLALVPQSQGEPGTIGVFSQSYTSGTSGSLQLASYNGSSKLSSITSLMADIPLPAQKQGFAAVKLNDWSKTLYLVLLDDGTIKGGWLDGPTVTSLPSITFDGGPAVNFSAIALTLDGMFYGICQDELQEYQVNRTDPSILNYVGRVYP
ncbi:hypothetical protein BX600DRAFT_457849 [Xylariales sp. PMI_506]|nr:hypothetical protein BX600DRAFT_457849 [Xylariales sp. PMI_506]